MPCRSGHGHTVREVIEAIRRVSGRKLPSRDVPRRPGDPVELVADNSRIRQVLGWKPKHDDLEFIVRTAWEWELKMAGGGFVGAALAATGLVPGPPGRGQGRSYMTRRNMERHNAEL